MIRVRLARSAILDMGWLLVVAAIISVGCTSSHTLSDATGSTRPRAPAPSNPTQPTQPTVSVVTVQNGATNSASNVSYVLDLDNPQYMNIKVENHSDVDIQCSWPSTHIYDFHLRQNGQIVWDQYRDDPNIARLDWATTMLLKAHNGGAPSTEIWYSTLQATLRGTYEFEFYYSCDKLKNVPHLTGTIQL